MKLEYLLETRYCEGTDQGLLVTADKLIRHRDLRNDLLSREKHATDTQSSDGNIYCILLFFILEDDETFDCYLFKHCIL
jgi:hypothetical protein